MLILPAARRARDFAGSLALLKAEGAGNAGCSMHPQPRARWVLVVCARVFTAEAPETSGIPHAMVLRCMAYSPRRRIRLASVAGELMVCLARLGRHASADLTPATVE